MEKQPIDEEEDLIIEPVDETEEVPEEILTETTIGTQSPVASANAEEPQELREVKEFAKYVCKKCNYKFTRKTGTTQALKCPYCGGENVEEDTFDINQAIREVR